MGPEDDGNDASLREGEGVRGEDGMYAILARSSNRTRRGGDVASRRFVVMGEGIVFNGGDELR